MKEVTENMYCIISSVLEYITIDVSESIPILTYSASLSYNEISILIYLKTPGLGRIPLDTWSSSIFIDTSSNVYIFCQCHIVKIKILSFKGSVTWNTIILKYVANRCI